MSMTPEAALYKFWSGFGMPAYPSNAVPEDTTYPWLTYEVSQSDFEDGPVDVAVNLWYHTDQEAEPNAKVREIAEKITRGGILLPCDGGAIWITKGTPFCINVNDTTDLQVKMRQLNISMEYQL